MLFYCPGATTLARILQGPPPPASRTAVAIDGKGGGVLGRSESPVREGLQTIRHEFGSVVLAADLVNCPVAIFVAPGGNSVVTMDLWRNVGSDALVFYGSHGAVLKRYENAERELVTAVESSKIMRSVSSFNWSQGAHADFTADGGYFWVWLPSGRVMMFEVSTGSAIDAASLRLDLGRGRPIVLKTAQMMSDSPIPSKRIASARLAGWLNGRAVLPILAKLAADSYHEDTGQQTRAERSVGTIWGCIPAAAPKSVSSQKSCGGGTSHQVRHGSHIRSWLP